MSDAPTPDAPAPDATTPSAPGPPASGQAADLAGGLEDGARFRCDQCGNVTRFDVVGAERTRRYLHFDLGGGREVEEEEVLERRVDAVTCRWCGRGDRVRVEPAPAAQQG